MARLTPEEIEMLKTREDVKWNGTGAYGLRLKTGKEVY